MKRLLLFFLFQVATASFAFSAPTQQTPPPQTPPAPAPTLPQLVLTGGTVIDVTNWGDSAHDLPNAVVIIRDGHVTEVGSPADVQVPKGSRVIDCTGKFLIPGLIDGFAGMSSQAEADANLYMGVTTVVARADKERGFVDLGANPSPHLYLIDSVGVTDNWSLLAHQPDWTAKLREGTHPVELSPDDTARQIADTVKLGTRVLLLGPHVTAANAQWIIARAHDQHLVTYGQFVSTPYRVGIEAGVDILLHARDYDLGVIPDELQMPLVEDPDGASAVTAYDYSERIPSTDARLRGYAKFLASHHAALMPTFSLFYVELPDHRNLWKEPAAELLSPAHMDHPTDPATGEMVYPLPSWARHLPAVGQRWLEADQQKKADQAALRLWRINQTIFAAFPHYLAGSGADALGTMPGISLHTELELLVRLGLSAREALAAATNNYELQLGWSELGQIAPGRRADILVLDGDPTTSIWNARRISTLIVDGNVLDRDALLHPKK
ncbi:MAG TPA: amidohydrolase family protein [Terracidiphilus sp.]|nr:amidohydrolase family protein [Terracidiphilus sp.]